MNDLTQVAPADPHAPSKLLCRGWLLGIEDADHHGMCTLRVRDANMERRVIVPHAGFSIGFDRLVAFMMGSADIRGAVMFPRIPKGPIKP